MTTRQEKLKSLIVELASQFIEKESNRQSLITVTNADISSDLKRATIFITVYPDSRVEQALWFLKRNAGSFRSFAKRRWNMKIIPFFEFAIDEGERNRQRIEEISNMDEDNLVT